MIINALLKIRLYLLSLNLKGILNTGVVMIFVSLSVSCASVQSTDASSHPNEAGTDVKQNCAAINSEQKLFCLKLISNVQPVPVNQIHSWTLHLENANGEPVENAKILIYGGMPAHKHGFPTNPQITENMKGGKYLLDGVKFSMHGQWEIWLNITADKIIDKAVFKIDVM